MLEVSTLPSPSKAAEHHAGGFLPTSSREDDDCFMVPDDSLLDYIDFTACCDVVPSFFDADGDILPDLEVDPATEELLAEFETTSSPAPAHHRHHDNKENKEPPPPDDDSIKKTNEVRRGVTSEDSTKSSASAEGQSNNKQKTTSKPSTKNSHGNNKKKAKVEWTPELHRKFVQAVEQLGIDKAVPSRILEIMGSQCCLTRHNIASHLQKYRSHRKHVMAREAEAATWAQKRQMYAPMQTNKDMTTMPPPPPPLAGPCPWVVPTTIIGFPPPPPPFGVRPLHVWGHPPAGVEAPAVLPVWPRHLLPRPWVYWQQQQYNNNAARKWGPTQCVPPPPAAVMLPRFPAPGMTMYRPASPPQSSKRLRQLDAQPSKESIDAAIGDVLGKPWLPLPLGLKPPSLDSVMSELHKQGIPSIPIPPAPTKTTSGS